jgi:hypothetical protein
MLDSTAAVAAERQGKNAHQLIEAVVAGPAMNASLYRSCLRSNSRTASLVPIQASGETSGSASLTNSSQVCLFNR